jgi:hypothetical protein
MALGAYGRGLYGAGLYGVNETPAYPNGPIDIAVEMLIGSTWTDITPLALYRDGINNRRGRQADNELIDKSTGNLSINNRNGDFSPRNPNSPYYGRIGRNTQMRVSMRAGAGRLVATTDSNSRATSPDSAQQTLAGDIDLAFDMSTSNWRLGRDFFYKFDAAGNQRSYYLSIDFSGYLVFRWSNDGATTLTSTSTQPVNWPLWGRKAVRVTLDVDNGAAGNTTTFYVADTIDSTFVQLGDPVVKVGTTSIFDSTAQLTIDLDTRCVINAAWVKSGIGGTKVANPDFRIQPRETTTFIDSTGAVWSTVGTTAMVDTNRYRVWGEVSSLPQKWDTTGNDVWTPVEINGPFRRFSQGATPLKSALYRGITTADEDQYVAYWPAEDGTNSTSIASGLGGTAMRVEGTPSFATYTAFAASNPLPTVNNSRWVGTVPTHTDTGEVQFRCLMAIPSTLTSNIVLYRLWCGGTAERWDIIYNVTGDLTVKSYNNVGTNIYDSGAINMNMDGKDSYFAFQLVQNGANIDWDIATFEIGSDIALIPSGTLAANTITRVLRVEVSPDKNVDEMACGHISVSSTATNPSLGDTDYDLITAYSGRETAIDRLQRLCDEEGIGYRPVGITSASSGEAPDETMGPQLPRTLLDLLHEAERTDGGIFFEDRESFGFLYLLRAGLYNRNAQIELDYAQNQMVDFVPVDDDLTVRNDITVQRSASGAFTGSSATAILPTGVLSVQAPPDGVGRYDTTIQINNTDDDILIHYAYFQLHLGTLDRSRASLTVHLGNPKFSGNLNLTGQILDLDIGSRVDVANPPAWLPPDDMTFIVQGYSEHISNFEHIIEFDLTADAPWQFGVYNQPYRYSSDGSELAAACTATDTALSIQTLSGPLWTTDPADMPFDVVIDGERMTVTAISGTSNPQTFTVTRSVNGVVKGHSQNHDMELFAPTYYAL